MNITKNKKILIKNSEQSYNNNCLEIRIRINNIYFSGILETVTRMWESHGRSTYKAILGYDAFVMLNDPDTVEVIGV